MEFVLVAPLVLLMVVGIVELAIIARTSLELAGAAREGARAAATSPAPDDAVSAALEALPEMMASVVAVTVRRPPVVGTPAIVTVRYHHRLLPMLGGVRIPLEFSASMRVER